jgi:hypothetical protein
MAVLTSGSFPFINANALKIKVHSEFLTPTRTAIDPGALHIWSQTRILPFSCHSLTDVPSCSQIGWNDTWQTLGSYQVAKISALLSLDFVCFCSKNSLYFSDPSWDLSYLIRPCFLQSEDGTPISNVAYSVNPETFTLRHCLNDFKKNSVKSLK